MTNTKIEQFSEAGLHFIRITNEACLSVTFCSLGASIFSIEFLGEKMTYNPKNPQDFIRKNVYHGKTIGRVAGRIKGDQIDINGTSFKLAANEDGNVLHGGNGAVSEKVFSSIVSTEDKGTRVSFSYLSKDGEAGFPGDALIEVSYFIPFKEASLKIEYTVKVNKDCPISLTTHTYFCLGDSNINNLSLLAKSSKQVLIDNNELTIKGSGEVPSYLDFRKQKLLIEDINAKELNEGRLCGYDHILLLDAKDPKVVLENKKFKFTISTDLDALVFYTDNYQAGFEANNSKDKIRRGIALETQLNPLKDRILRPTEEFKHFINYSFQAK